MRRRTIAALSALAALLSLPTTSTALPALDRPIRGAVLSTHSPYFAWRKQPGDEYCHRIRFSRSSQRDGFGRLNTSPVDHVPSGLSWQPDDPSERLGAGTWFWQVACADNDLDAYEAWSPARQLRVRPAVGAVRVDREASTVGPRSSLLTLQWTSNADAARVSVAVWSRGRRVGMYSTPLELEVGEPHEAMLDVPHTALPWESTAVFRVKVVSAGVTRTTSASFAV